MKNRASEVWAWPTLLGSWEHAGIGNICRGFLEASSQLVTPCRCWNELKEPMKMVNHTAEEFLQTRPWRNASLPFIMADHLPTDVFPSLGPLICLNNPYVLPCKDHYLRHAELRHGSGHPSSACLVWGTDESLEAWFCRSSKQDPLQWRRKGGSMMGLLSFTLTANWPRASQSQFWQQMFLVRPIDSLPDYFF